MIIYTKAQMLPLKSTKTPTEALIDNDAMFVAEAPESGESDFARALDDALSREGARFGFVFDYSMDRHARSLYAGCTLTKGNWLLQSGRKIAKADGTR